MAFPLWNINEKLKESISHAGSGIESCIYEPYLVLYNSSGFQYQARYIKNFVISQDYVGNYMDEFQIAIDVTVHELMDILKNIQGLMAYIKLFPMDMVTLDPGKGDILTFNLNVYIDDQQDPVKKFQPASFGDQGIEVKKGENDALGAATTPQQAEAQTSFIFHGIEVSAYTMRHRQLNAICKDSDLKHILYWSAYHLGASDCHIIEPDNTTVYPYVVIPPMTGAAKLFPYLQERFGIYARGLAFYYSQGLMNVWPPFDTDTGVSLYDGVCHLINAPAKTYLGNDHYHVVDDKDLYIASITESTLEPLNTQATENRANVHLSSDADKLKDNWTQVNTETNQVFRKADTLTAVLSANTARNMVSGATNVSFKGERVNLFQTSSDMAATDGTILKCGWAAAKPRLFLPGMNVVYHYEGQKGKYLSQKGRALAAFYSSSLVHSRTGTIPWLRFDAMLAVKLEAENTVTDMVV